MGWCSATMIFDDVCDAIFNEKADKEKILDRLIGTLHDMDWDCEMDSAYVDHPVVRKLFIERGIIEETCFDCGNDLEEDGLCAYCDFENAEEEDEKDELA